MAKGMGALESAAKGEIVTADWAAMAIHMGADDVLVGRVVEGSWHFYDAPLAMQLPGVTAQQVVERLRGRESGN